MSESLNYVHGEPLSPAGETASSKKFWTLTSRSTTTGEVMLKTSLFVALFALLGGSFLGTMAPELAHAQDVDMSDDLFMDEGEGDFAMDPIPVDSTAEVPSVIEDEPVVQTESAPTETVVEKPVEKAVEKRAAKKVVKPAEKPVKKQAIAPAVKKAVAAAGRFETTKEACPMLREPASGGSQMLVVRESRKIWVEEVDQNWVRAFDRHGDAGYLSRDCFQ